MKSYILKKGEQINYNKLCEVLSSTNKEIVLGQYLTKFEKTPELVPMIFCGVLDPVAPYTEGDFVICLSKGLGSIYQGFRKRMETLPIIKKENKEGLVSVIDSRKKIIFEDEELVEVWKKAEEYWLWAVHQRGENKTKEIEEFLECCRNYSNHRQLLDIYGFNEE